MAEIRRVLGRGWRFFATLACFLLFGLGCVLLWCGLWPVLALVEPNRRNELGKRWVHRCFRAFVAILTGSGACTMEVHGAERLQRGGLLILANHPSLIDVVMLVALSARPDCVVKSALLQRAIIGSPLRLAGFISNDSGPQLIDDCIASIREGHDLVLFPEGTRSVPGRKLHFQRGAANIAVRGQFDITPVIISCSVPTLTKHGKWYVPPPVQPHFVLTVLDDIAVAPLLAPIREPALQARTLSAYLERFFEHEVARLGGKTAWTA